MTENSIDDEFAFLDTPVGGIDLDSDPANDDGDDDAEGVDQSNTLMNPLTGSLVDMDSIDSVVLACVDAKKQLNDLRCFEETLRRHLGSLTTGKAKTRRVRGKELTAKIEMPDEGWDQSILKEAYSSYSQFRDQFLKIGTVSVKKVEFNKLKEMTTDDPAFNQFKGMLEAAVRPATSAPTVSLEG